MSTTETSVADLTAVELLELYRNKDLSPVEATEAALQRIDHYNGAVNAYCHVDHDGALAAAKAWTAFRRRLKI
jgi:aspartyl-tRNA(Asn)/glutamyl-tRNA(Gln) amidotransferase subunit A